MRLEHCGPASSLDRMRDREDGSGGVPIDTSRDATGALSEAQREWLALNGAEITAYNALVEERGVFSDEWRRF
jgi:post-segregation antitoxin (ccd killing protein)